MSFRTRIYETKKLNNGKRVVTSGKVSDYFFLRIIKFIFKAFMFCMFFWIIIPVKLIKRKK